MSVLVVASSKGGPGKTTIAEVLAASLAREMAVVAIDADPTCAFSRWANGPYEGPRFEVHAEADETRLAHLIDRSAQDAGLVIVDTAGFGNRAATVAMTSADGVIVPALAGEADVTEAEKTIRLVEGLARAARREIPARVLFNRTKPRTTLARHAATEATRAGLPIMQNGLSDLVAFGELSYSGVIPTTGTAAAEIAALISEMRGLGWILSSTHVEVTP